MILTSAGVLGGAVLLLILIVVLPAVVVVATTAFAALRRFKTFALAQLLAQTRASVLSASP